MDITPLISKDHQVILSYKGGVFNVSNTSYNGAVIVTLDKTFYWDIGDITDILKLDEQHFSYFIDNSSNIDVLLLGCGRDMCFMPDHLCAVFRRANLSVDIMITAAACRTYNILLSEGRRVACALLPVT